MSNSYSSWVPALARLLMGLFYRKVEVVGSHRVDPSRPLLYLANHNNSLIDPALLVAFLPGRPRFLAKATLWERRILRPFLSMARVIPVHRRQDPGFDASHNESVFRQCHEVLGQGGAVALFPEGRSHTEPSLGDLKTGAARIALGAAREYGVEVDLVPVGLVFERKDQFRSRVLMKVGEPLRVAPENEAAGEGEEVRQWTESIRGALSAITLNYPSWEEAHWIERAADLFRGESGGLPVEESPENRFEISQAFIEGYARLAQERPALLEDLRGALREYDSLLRTWKVRDDHVASRYPWAPVTRFVLRSLVSLLILMPLALLGLLWNYIPYRLSGWVGAGVARQPDLGATYKLFAGMLFYPLAWALVALFLGLRLHPLAGIAFCLGPISGVAALFYRDRGGSLWREGRAFLRLARYRDGWRALRERRKILRGRILEQIQWVNEESAQ